MKILQFASDLHLEFLQRFLAETRLVARAPSDVLVLAGDIAGGTDAITLFKDWPTPVVYVAGNHEFYGRDMQATRKALRATAAGTKVHFLDNDFVEVDGVRFLGTTLWTDYTLFGAEKQAECMRLAASGLNDHFQIRLGDRAFSPDDALAEHQRARAWLADELAKPFDGKTVVVTHHGCHPMSVHPRYRGDLLNAAFVSDLTDLLNHADLWLHGHVHDSFDYQVGRCRVIANPAGYALNRKQVNGAAALQFENRAFEPALVLDTNRLDERPAEAVAEPMPETAYWTCAECADTRLGPERKTHHAYHVGTCDLCGMTKSVTTIDDYYER